MGQEVTFLISILQEEEAILDQRGGGAPHKLCCKYNNSHAKSQGDTGENL